MVECTRRFESSGTQTNGAFLQEVWSGATLMDESLLKTEIRHGIRTNNGDSTYLQEAEGDDKSCLTTCGGTDPV
jgi:hypothetical protein